MVCLLIVRALPDLVLGPLKQAYMLHGSLFLPREPFNFGFLYFLRLCTRRIFDPLTLLTHRLFVSVID